jgi:hypothetical protein
VQINLRILARPSIFIAVGNATENDMTDLTKTLTTREAFARYVLENRLDDCTPNADGTPDEALYSGYINALDTEEDRGAALTEDEFLGYAFDAYRNSGYDREMTP